VKALIGVHLYLFRFDIFFYTPVSKIREQFPSLTEPQIETTIRNFKAYDLNGDGVLDFHEISKMMEKLKQTKTAAELKQMINEAAGGKTEMNFNDFLSLVGGPATIKKFCYWENLSIVSWKVSSFP